MFVMIYKACEEYQRVKVQVHKEPPIKPLCFHYISPECSLVGHTLNNHHRDNAVN